MLDNENAEKQYEEVRVLVVDDDEISVRAVYRALKKLKLVNPIRVAQDGVQALEILRGESGEEQLLPPYIVLLDINMPRMNGHEFLAEIRDDPALHRALVFVLTTSDAPEDVMKAYDKNVSGYIVKDDIYQSFKNTLELVDLFSKVVVFPK